VEAFTKLVRAHSSLVYRVALRMLGNEDAETAEVLEVPDGTAKGRVSRGRAAHQEEGRGAMTPVAGEQERWEAPEAIVSYAVRRAYLSAFSRQAERVMRGLMRDYVGGLISYLGLRPAR
jgi:hypothetical protein